MNTEHAAPLSHCLQMWEGIISRYKERLNCSACTAAAAQLKGWLECPITLLFLLAYATICLATAQKQQFGIARTGAVSCTPVNVCRASNSHLNVFKDTRLRDGVGCQGLSVARVRAARRLASLPGSGMSPSAAVIAMWAIEVNVLLIRGSSSCCSEKLGTKTLHYPLGS